MEKNRKRWEEAIEMIKNNRNDTDIVFDNGRVSVFGQRYLYCIEITPVGVYIRIYVDAHDYRKAWQCFDTEGGMINSLFMDKMLKDRTASYDILRSAIENSFEYVFHSSNDIRCDYMGAYEDREMYLANFQANEQWFWDNLENAMKGESTSVEDESIDEEESEEDIPSALRYYSPVIAINNVYPRLVPLEDTKDEFEILTK